MHRGGLVTSSRVPYPHIMPRVIVDYAGRRIRLTNERLAHIREHPEMGHLQAAIAETIRAPMCVVESLSDSEARLYYRRHTSRGLGEKYVCVIVKVLAADAFVLPAYLTDCVKKGRLLWPARE